MSEFEIMILQQINEIIKNTSNNTWIQNLISTLAGVFLGFLLTIFAQKAGRLKYYIVSSSIKYSKNNNGSLEKVRFEDEYESCEIEIVIDFHNTSQNNIGIRNIEIILEEQREKKSLNVKDIETRRIEKYFVVSDTVEILNIESHTVLRKKFSAFIDNDMIRQIKEKPKMYLSFINKNRKKVIKIVE
jgi:hypothetical protein